MEPKSADWTPDPIHCRYVQLLRGGVDGDVDYFPHSRIILSVT